MVAYKYKAFISYSHKDERWARWLHRRLESYPIPSHLIGQQTNSGVVPKRLKPIFRDREELAAADSLGEKIEQALADSESLIIICSPHAAQSHWVNQEIISFKRQNRGAKIFSLIVDGEPFASKISGCENEECFPAALRFKVDTDGNITKDPAEPLAADIRTQGDGKRLGLLKLVSGMIGVGLDEIIQRDMRRGRKRVMAITATSLVTVLAMGTLTGFAMSARKDAEARRNDAEENIEFMITDLKKELESAGRLSALKVVGKRAEAYYDKYPISKHNDEALGRRARVFHYLGEILNTEGYRDDADKYFKRAYTATAELLARDPQNADRIFEHAQSAFYSGFALWNANEYKQARPFFDEYIDLAKALKRVEPDSLRAKQEVVYANTNLGILLFKQGYAKDAIEIYRTAIPAYEEMALEYPNNVDYQLKLANAYAWMADAHFLLSPLAVAMEYNVKQITVLQRFRNEEVQNHKILLRLVPLQTARVKFSFLTNTFATTKSELNKLLELSQELNLIEPKNVTSKEFVAISNILMGKLLLTKQQYEMAIKHRDIAQSILTAMAPNEKDISEQLRSKVEIPLKLLTAKILRENGEYEPALEVLLSIPLQKMEENNTLSSVEKSLRIQTLGQLADVHTSLNQLVLAQQLWKEILPATDDEMLTLMPNVRVIVARAYFELGLMSEYEEEVAYLTELGVKNDNVNFINQKKE